MDKNVYLRPTMPQTRLTTLAEQSNENQAGSLDFANPIRVFADEKAKKIKF